MRSLTIVLRALPEHRAAFVDACLAVVAPSRAEPGCLFFDLLVSEKDADEVVFYEAYVDEAAFQAHMAAPHTREWQAKALPLVDRPSIRFPAHRGITPAKLAAEDLPPPDSWAGRSLRSELSPQAS